MDDDRMKMLPKNLESRISWDEVQNEFGSTEIIFIAFGREDSLYIISIHYIIYGYYQKI